MSRTRSLYFEIIPLALLILSIIGVAFTQVWPMQSHYYWFGLFAVFCVIFVFIDTKRADDPGFSSAMLMQWLTTIVALAIVYLMIETGVINHDQAALFSILLLALSVVLSGIKLGFRFVLIGLYLFTIVALIAYLEEFIVPLLILAFFALIVEAFWIHKRIKASRNPPSDQDDDEVPTSSDPSQSGM